MAVALKPKTLIGGLNVVKVIGRGGFGITYEAVDVATDTTYAVKEYLPEGICTREGQGLVTALPGQQPTFDRGLAAFMTEGNILKDLPRRQGLVRVRGVFKKFGTAYCVMEFIAGDSLDRMANRLVQRYGRVPANLVTDMAVAICWALAALHGEKLIHRDVKPANIMLRKTGQPVLIDFGAARKLSGRDVKETIFTRKYAAIEQFPTEISGFGREFDEGPWSDIYSLSVVLHALVANKAPPDAATRAQAVLNGSSDPYVPLETDSNLQGTYPPALLATIDQGCALMPKARVQSAQAFANRIDPEAWSKRAQAEEEAGAQTTFEAKPPKKAARGNAGRFVLLAAILGGLCYYLYHQAYFSAEIF